MLRKGWADQPRGSWWLLGPIPMARNMTGSLGCRQQFTALVENAGRSFETSCKRLCTHCPYPRVRYVIRRRGGSQGFEDSELIYIHMYCTRSGQPRAIAIASLQKGRATDINQPSQVYMPVVMREETRVQPWVGGGASAIVHKDRRMPLGWRQQLEYQVNHVALSAYILTFSV